MTAPQMHLGLTGQQSGHPMSAVSERIPGRLRREFDVAEIRAEPQTNACADRHDNDVAGAERGHAKTADEISRAADAGEALIDRVGRGEIVDQHHRSGAFAAVIETDRRALPEYPAVASILCIKIAVAVAQAADERATSFLSKNIAIGLAPATERCLNNFS